MTKIEHIKKLLIFLGAKLFKPMKFTAPIPLPRPLHDALYKRMVKNTLLIDRDVLEVSFNPEYPHFISIYSALESHHNGSLYDEHSEEVPVFVEFLDFAIDVLRNRAHNVVVAQIEAEENQRKQLRAETRMKELGL